MRKIESSGDVFKVIVGTICTGFTLVFFVLIALMWLGRFSN